MVIVTLVVVVGVFSVQRRPFLEAVGPVGQPYVDSETNAVVQVFDFVEKYEGKCVLEWGSWCFMRWGK